MPDTDGSPRLFTKAADPPWDATSLLAVMWNQWNDVLDTTLHLLLSLARQPSSEVRRNGSSKWAVIQVGSVLQMPGYACIINLNIQHPLRDNPAVSSAG